MIKFINKIQKFIILVTDSTDKDQLIINMHIHNRAKKLHVLSKLMYYPMLSVSYHLIHRKIETYIITHVYRDIYHYTYLESKR